jgi:hypothetical protein
MPAPIVLLPPVTVKPLIAAVPEGLTVNTRKLLAPLTLSNVAPGPLMVIPWVMAGRADVSVIVPPIAVASIVFPAEAFAWVMQ